MYVLLARFFLWIPVNDSQIMGWITQHKNWPGVQALSLYFIGLRFVLQKNQPDCYSELMREYIWNDKAFRLRVRNEFRFQQQLNRWKQ